MRTFPFFLGIALFVLMLGCATEGPYVPAKRTPSPEVTNSSVILDREIADAIAVDLVGSEKTPQGKLLALANIRNRTNQDTRIQYQVVFRDEEGFSINDDTAWEVMTLTANETRGMNVSSTSKQAKRFTLRIRMMR